MSITTGTTDIIGVNAVSGAAYNTPLCAKGASAMLLGVSLKAWNTSALRSAMDIFATLPLEFRNSIVLLEAYSTNGVTSIPPDSTAYAERLDQVLVGPLIVYAPNASLDDVAASYGKRIRAAMVEGSAQPFHGYVNYALGDESLEAFYGYEPWRVEKLRKIKEEYDPFDRFRFYAPISMDGFIDT